MTIVPYNDEEIPSAVCRMMQDEVFISLSQMVYPDLSFQQIKEKICSISTIRQFQCGPMMDFFNQLKKQTFSDFTYSISPLFDPFKASLFVSNHRDITLDAFILEIVFCQLGYPTSKVAFGSNLLDVPLFGEVGRANKLFSVERCGSPKAYYQSLMQLSQYIRDSINQGESVWIAQRNGRTKNGFDHTEPAIVKMFALSGEGSVAQRLASLNIVPVSISYEWEPCDLLKALELAHTIDGVYHKQQGEDTVSVKTGLLSHKGHVHITVGDPLQPQQIAACNDCHKGVAACLDKAICGGYRLSPNNYVAADIREASSRYASHYSEQQATQFRNYLDNQRQAVSQMTEACDNAFVERVMANLLNIYANPVGRID